MEDPNSSQPNLHSFDLYNDYPLPDWSSIPTKDYFLEIMKSGVILEEKKLTEKAFFLIGRLVDLSDIVLEHPSISRKHAVLQHKNNGELYIYDLESTHGTFVNSRKIPPRVFVKLTIGDMIKFGASLRFYIVRCLEIENESKGVVGISTDMDLIKSSINLPKLEQNKAKKLYLKLLKNYEASELGIQRERPIKKKEHDDNEINWGILDEEAVYNYQDENEFKMEPTILRQLPDLNEKQLEKIEQFEVKLNKYQSIEEEYEDLCRRERKDFGLDEVSKAKKENLEKKIQELAQQLETLEETLKLMIFKEKTEKRKLEKVLEEDTYNDDDYFDRTLDSKKLKKDPETAFELKEKPQPITYDFQTLKKKLEDLINQRNDLNVKILDFQPDKKSETEEELDELEKYMKDNQTSLDLQQRKKFMGELEIVTKEIDETKNLLRIVRPNYELKEKKEIFKTTEKPKENRTKTLETDKQQDPFTKPHEKVSKTLEKLHNLSKEYAERDKNIKDFTNYEKFRIYDEEEDEEKNKEKKQEEIIEPQKPKVYGVSTKPLPRNLKEKDVEKKKGIENMNWIPPQNQKGDGMTNLNKKFGY